MVATVIDLYPNNDDSLSLTKGAKCVARKSAKAAKFVTRKSATPAKLTFAFVQGFGRMTIRVMWYMLIINLMAAGFVALGVAAEWAIVPFFFLLWKGII